ncbi:MAG: glycosyltransferase family 4 protein [Phycisphaeraceae bacterium]|nr:glycosyltransferase family 4 protein [Phycisphaeraceae bacterium]
MADRKILFLSKSDTAASTRYRALNFFHFLQAAGWSPVHMTMPGSTDSWRQLLQEVRSADVTVVLRRLPGPLGRRRLRRAARHLIFDFDDAIHCGTAEAGSARRRRRFEAMVRLADQVWAGNRHLAEVARPFGRSVHRLVTSVDPGRYRTDIQKPADHLDLVWIGSSATRPYLEQLGPVLGRFSKSFPSARLKIVADFEWPEAPCPTVAVPWNEQTEAESLASAHIGVAPMPDNAWTRGKCGCKVLQYMAAGLPVVASDVLIHREILQPIGGGLVRNPAQWQEALARLGRDAELRRRWGELGRGQVEKNYALERTARQMVGLLDSASV